MVPRIFTTLLLLALLGLTALTSAQANNGTVTGFPGTCHPRRKIQTLQASFPEQFNMLVLALNELYDEPEASPDSYFGIAGIHGAPFRPWYQPAPGSPGAPTYNTNLGYCFHQTPIFSTWHRPYLLLLEQTVVRRAMAIAERFAAGSAARATYVAAAQQLRLPYWDWAEPAGRSALPPIVLSRATVAVMRPDAAGAAAPASVRNPFFNYPFQDVSSLSSQGFSGNFARWPTTVREPTLTGTSQDNLSSSNMQATHTNRRTSTYSALTSSTRFNTFSSSLESIHDTIHVLIGGQTPSGHMTVVSLSAFDPIFWLHHGNVDRLVAMWQALWPGVTITSRSPGTNTYANIVARSGSPADGPTTPLTPFRKADGSWWTSNDVPDAASIWRAGYAFDEVPCGYQGETPQALREFVAQRTNALYGPNAVSTASARRAKRAPQTPPPGTESPSYTLRIAYPTTSLPTSWTILFFLGPAPTSPSPSPLSLPEYLTHPSFLGTLAHFADASMSASMTPRRLVKDLVITERLLELGYDLTERRLRRELKRTLSWVVLGAEGEVVEKGVGGLRVGVYRRRVRWRGGGELPGYGAREGWPDVTEGKEGGVAGDGEGLFEEELGL